MTSRLSFVLLAATLMAVGCAPSRSKGISEASLLKRLGDAGLTVERLDPPTLQPDQLQALPYDPSTVLALEVSDGQGNREGMIAVELKATQDTERVKGVNGFGVRNWYFLGIVSTHMRDRVTLAIGTE